MGPLPKKRRPAVGQLDFQTLLLMPYSRAGRQLTFNALKHRRPR
jgi:hypothetical protein